MNIYHGVVSLFAVTAASILLGRLSNRFFEHVDLYLFIHKRISEIGK